MHTKFPIFVAYKTFYKRVQPNLLKQKQHELEIKSWSLKTKHKRDQTRSSKIVTTKINDKSQGAWKSVDTHYVAMKKERVAWGF
jgi:hypothetical protein